MKKILPFVQSYKVTPPLHHPKNDFMSKWNLIQPLQREIYNAYLLYSRQEQKSLVTYHTLQSLYVCVSLVNTLISTRADWISDNLHEISSRYLRTMGKEFNFQFSRRSWGRNRSCGVSRGVTNPWERLRGRLHKHFLFLFLNSDTALWHAFQPQRTSPRFNKLNESE